MDPGERLRAITVLACDYDRTLTDERLTIRAATRETLREARRAGLRIIVVSGRDAEFLREHVGDVSDLVVAENGAFLLHGDDPPQRLFATWPGAEALSRLGVPLETALASASADVAHATALQAAVAAAGLELRIERNRDRVMLLPAGVDKGTALAVALARLGASPAACAAVGDGENDVALLSAAGYRLAVGNAVDELKAVAHEELAGFGGEAVTRWLRERWLPARAAAPRRGAARRG